MKLFKISSLALAVILTGCGGSSSSSSDNGGNNGDSGGSTDPDANFRTGVFTDSAVHGIKYQTSPSGEMGTTSPLGEYAYYESDTVTFSIGGIPLPEVTATGRVTPADMGSESSPDQVTNILRLLQSLDDDGNPDNGISISESTHASLKNAELQLDQISPDFEAQFESEVETQTEKPLVSAGDAEDHFQGSQQADLRGSWKYVEPPGDSSNGRGPDGEEVNVITFLAGNRYIIAHKYGNDDQDPATAEWGTYEWDPKAEEVTFFGDTQSDGDGGACGFKEKGCKGTLQHDGQVINLVTDNTGVADFHAITSNPDDETHDQHGDHVGAWYLQEAEDQFNVLTLMADGSYVIAHNNNEETYGSLVIATSSEWGTYSIDDGKLDITGVTSETDGAGGLYDKNGSEPPRPLAVERWGDLSMEDNEDGAFSFHRIGRFPVSLVYDGDELNTVSVERGRMFDPDSRGRWKIETRTGRESPETVIVDLEADDKGTVEFSADDINNITWEVNAAGTLLFEEVDDFGDRWDWAVARLNEDGAALVSILSPEGQADASNELVEATLTPLDEDEDEDSAG